MANRSYLYAVDRIPGEGAGPADVQAVSEWNWEIPIAHRVLLTGSPRRCRSLIWDPPAAAVVGDYDTGVANLERFVALLPQTEKVRADAAAALSALRDPGRRRRYLLLEPSEIFDLLPDEPDAEPDEEVGGAGGPNPELEQAVEDELTRIGTIDGWLSSAPRIAHRDLDQATGAGSWSGVLYYLPEPAVPPATGPGVEFVPPTHPAPAYPAPAYPAPSYADAGPPAAHPAATYPAGRQGYPSAPPGHPAPTPVGWVPPGPPPSGTISWGLGLIALVPFPFVSAVAASIAMAVSGRAQRRHGPVAQQNGRNAANWGLTYLLLTAPLIAAHFAVLYAFARTGPVRELYPIGIPLTIWFAVSVLHVVICFVGVTRANRGAVFKAPAIPFFR